uniref:Uridine phosphorylase 2 n=1 Tax=Propithecus coquereli TaxID=379532 RepID=A0A2K6GN53_PROCO
VASVLPASNRSMSSDRNAYVGKRVVHVKNPHLDSVDEDSLSLGFGNENTQLTSNVPNRMKAFALFMHEELGYCMYKPGPNSLQCTYSMVAFQLCLGMTFIIGKSPQGRTYADSFLKLWFEQVILDDLSPNLFNCSKEIPNFPTLIGHTMYAYYFYEGQGRLEGALYYFSREKKLDYLKRAHKASIRDIERESTVFAAMCGLCVLKDAVVCVTLFDTLDYGQMNLPHDVLVWYQQQPQLLISDFIKQQLGLHD